jgi:hypothetical protein
MYGWVKLGCKLRDWGGWSHHVCLAGWLCVCVRFYGGSQRRVEFDDDDDVVSRSNARGARAPVHDDDDDFPMHDPVTPPHDAATDKDAGT